MPIDSRQYDSAIDFISVDSEFSKLVSNCSNHDDKMRVKAYELYEDFYANRPEHMKVTLRGEDDDSIEIYIPSAKKNIEAVNRFLAVGFNYQIDPDVGTETEQSTAEAALDALFEKQEVINKFNNMKRYMLVKGDALLHIKAIPWEKPGRRICIHELKPEHYFPIEDPATGYVMGCHLVDIMRNPRNTKATANISDEFIVRRQTYRRVVNDKNVPTGRITTELGYYQLSYWDDRVPVNEIREIQIIEERYELPEIIQNLPVYHWRNRPPSGSTFGTSALSGSESIINAINQSATDEDLTLITQGLGVYWTDASPPVDENGNEVEWEIGPGSVVQVATGAQFGRVTGVTSVQPFKDHMVFLDESMQQAMAVPDVAIGMVDVQAVESGIALQLKFGPLLAQNAEIELPMRIKADEFLDDLLDWMQFYEGVATQGISISTIFEDPMPKNKAELLKTVLDIWSMAPSTMPISWLYERLNEIFGWDLDETVDFQQALADAKEIAQIAMPVDPFGAGMGAAATDAQGNPITPPEDPAQNGNVPSFMSIA